MSYEPGIHIKEAVCASHEDRYLKQLARQRTRRRLKKDEDPNGEIKKLFTNKAQTDDKTIEEMVEEIYKEINK